MTPNVHDLVRLDASTHSLYLIEHNRRVRLTKKEYHIFHAFIQNGLLSDEDVAREVFGCSDDKCVRECLDKHIDHLRAKIRVYGWDIYRVLRYGYILLPYSK
jgi:DNA-binding response OmpR family regulator